MSRMACHSWSSGDDSVRSWLWDVTCPTILYVAVGDRATVMTSINGVDWKLELVPEAVTNSIFLGLGGTTSMLIAAGDKGSLIISPNGISGVLVTTTINWESIGTLTRKNLCGAATDSRQLIAVGVEGAILRSPVVADSNAVRFLSYDRFSVGSGSEKTAQNLFLFSGRTDQQFTLDYHSTFDTNIWVTGPKLEFLDGSGTLFYLETLLTSDPLPLEFYRATLALPPP